MSYYRNINSVVQALSRARKEGIRVNLLIGAGCSITAGIPAADGIINKIKKEYSAETESLKNETYSNYMGKLTPIERRKLINEYVKDSKINWAYIGMAHLMKNNFIHRVLTTNFDNIFLRACSLVEEFPGIYDMTTYGGEFRSDLLSEKSILYLHGQHTSFVLCNTEKEVKEQREKLEDTFNELKRNSMWIIVGYSCMNDAIWQLLSNEPSFENRLYLIGYENNNENDNMKKILGEDKYAFYVKDYNADSFFISLMHELDIFPPKIIDKPFTYLSDTIISITEYKNNNSFLSGSYNGAALEILNKAVEDYEKNDLLMAKYYYELGVFDKFEHRLQKLIEREEEEGYDFGQTLFNQISEIDSRVMEEVKEFIIENRDKDVINPNIIKKLREAAKLILIERNEELDILELMRSIDNIYQKIDRNFLMVEDYKSWVDSILKLTEIDDINKVFNYLIRAESIYKSALTNTSEDSIILNNLSKLYLKMARIDEVNMKKYVGKLLITIEEAYNKNDENFEVIISWGIYLLNIILIDETRAEEFYNDAKAKFTQCASVVPRENIYDIKFIYEKELIKVFLASENDDIKNNCLNDFIDILEEIYINEDVEKAISMALESLLVKIINKENTKKYSYIFEKYKNCIKSTMERFYDSKNFSVFITNINNVSYYLLDNYEFKLSKELIELCIKQDNKNSFPFATKGLWYFRNKEINIEESEEKGVKYYTRAYEICDCDNDLCLAIKQKYYYEYAVFLYERKGNTEDANNYLTLALEIGEIKKYLKNYYDAKNYMDKKNIKMKPIEEIAIDNIVKIND